MHAIDGVSECQGDLKESSSCVRCQRLFGETGTGGRWDFAISVTRTKGYVVAFTCTEQVG